MYYEPKYFIPQEFFSRKVFNREKDKGNRIWRLIDSRILWTADKIREHFCGNRTRGSKDVMTINNWAWSGDFQLRGFRDVYLDYVQAESIFAVTSQHCFGRAIDYTFNHTMADEVQADIIKNPNAERYKYITAIEISVPWNHNDVRSWDKSNGILTFGKLITT